MIRCNPSVQLYNITPQVVLGIQIVNSVWIAQDWVTSEEWVTPLHRPPMVITSLSDGVHSPKSLHYHGRAFDMRSISTPNDRKKNFLLLCRRALGPEWDVIDESTHFHFEWDPERRA